MSSWYYVRESKYTSIRLPLAKQVNMEARLLVGEIKSTLSLSLSLSLSPSLPLQANLFIPAPTTGKYYDNYYTWSKVTHVVEKFSPFYEPRSSITVLTASWHYVKPVDSNSNYTLHAETYFSIFELRLNFSDCIFHYVTSTKTVQVIARHAQLTFIW